MTRGAVDRTTCRSTGARVHCHTNAGPSTPSNQPDHVHNLSSACPVTRPTPYRFIGGSSSRLGGVHIDRSCAAAAFWTRHSLLRARLSAPATGRPPTDRAMTDPRQSLHVRDADGGERDGGCSHSCSKTWCDALGRLRRGETVRLCMPRQDGTRETRCEGMDRARVAHNPEVGGSNPPPATENCLMA